MGCFTVVIECLWGVYRGCYTVFRVVIGYTVVFRDGYRVFRGMYSLFRGGYRVFRAVIVY